MTANRPLALYPLKFFKDVLELLSIIISPTVPEANQAFGKESEIC